MEGKKRKHPRLKEYDYSLPGYYYVTIHGADASVCFSRVGRGLAPADGAVVHLTKLGEIARANLFALEERYPTVRIQRYVFMPTHLHAVIRLVETAGASPRPTLMDVIGAYKSLTTRACNREFGTPGRKIFQTSFYETVLRNEYAYVEACRYIDENPAKWFLSHGG
jgi:hypothetical protein